MSELFANDKNSAAEPNSTWRADPAGRVSSATKPNAPGQPPLAEQAEPVWSPVVVERRDRVTMPAPVGGGIPVEQPLEASRPAPQPLFRKLLPLVMVVAVVGMVAIMVLSGHASNPMTYLFPLIMVASMVGMAGGQQEPSIEAKRRVYLRHLDRCKNEALDAARTQREAALWANPDPEALWTFAVDAQLGGSRLWERSPKDKDFLHVRIGLSSQRPLRAVEIQDVNAVEDIDPICALALRRTLRQTSAVERCPISVALLDFPVIYLSGFSADDTARAIIAQVVTLHSPDDVAVMVCGLRPQWNWLAWLPHSAHAEPCENADDLLQWLDSWDGPGVVLVVSTAVPLSVMEHPKVVHVLVCDDYAVADEISEDERFAARRLASLDQWSRCAAEEGMALHIHDGQVAALTVEGLDTFGQADGLSAASMQVLCRHVSRCRTAVHTEASVVVGGIELILGTANPENVEPAAAWTYKTGRDRLRIPLGTKKDNWPFYLDIKESAEGGAGPHGLIVGATGSGKSELLKTLVLSLVASHSPEQVNAVLVDFKGGATFLGLEDLPHVAAVITNLEEESLLVSRMQDAVGGELTRRQEFLRKAGVSSAAEYAKVREKSSEKMPSLPALVIIIDEFSELLSAHPDFIDLFVAIGRLGRSLGIHLILSTQRLEEGKLRGLDAHLSYRLGLRTFSAQESRAVLGVPDAHSLPKKPGHGLARLGSDAITAFRATYVSAEWSAESTIMQEVIERLSENGCNASQIRRWEAAHEIWLPPLPAILSMAELNQITGRLDHMGSGDRDGQLDHEVSALSEASLGYVGSGEALQPTIGLIDAPREQAQLPWELDLSGRAGHIVIVGAPQAGASTTVRTILATIALSTSTRHVQFYALDLAGTGLSLLERLPHTVAVIRRHEQEKIRRFIAEITMIADERRTLWIENGWHTVDAARAAGQHDIFIALDGWHVVRSEFPELEETLGTVAAEGLNVGIHLIVTAQRWGALRPALRELLGTKIELGLGEPMESVVDRKVAEHVPKKPGRALVSHNGRALHALVAHCTAQDIAEVCRIAHARGDHRVEQLKLLPNSVGLQELESALDTGGKHRRPAFGDHSVSMPLGIEGRRLQTWAWDAEKNPAVLVIGKSECGKTNTLRAIATLICRTHKSNKESGASKQTIIDAEIIKSDPYEESSPRVATGTPHLPMQEHANTSGGNSAESGRRAASVVVIDPRRTLLGEMPDNYLAGYTSHNAAAEELLGKLLVTIKERMPDDSVTPAQLKARSWWQGPDIYVLIDDYDLLSINPAVTSEFASVLPHLRDVGVHVVLARKSAGMMRAAHDPVIAGLRSINCVSIVLSGDKDDGPVFGIPLESRAPGRGYVTEGQSGNTEIQLALAESTSCEQGK